MQHQARILRYLSLAVFVALLATPLMVATAQAPGYKNLRFDEDWSNQPEEGYGDPFDRIKNIHVSDGTTLSVGGHIRLRHESWSNFGFAHQNDDTFLSYRTFFHTDWHFGEHFRIFAEVKSSDIILSQRDLPGGRRSTLDEDQADIWNTFFEGNFKTGNQNLMFRIGRQEMQYGRQRLISPFDWANNRRIFDGVRIALTGAEKKWRLDAFWTIPVELKRHKFNQTDDIRNFSGLYYVVKLPKKLALDAYFLYLDTDTHTVDSEVYTVGTRLSGKAGHGLSFDFEAAYQFGNSTGGLDIDAWMIATEFTYRPAEVKLSPWVQVGFDWASGDDDPRDHDLGTFNQLFPLGHAYNGFMDVIGRQNIMDLRATVGFKPAKKVTIKTDFHFFRLADEDDGLYNAGGGLSRAGGVDERDVGREIDLTVTYKHDRHTTFVLGYSHFFAGDFIDDTGAHDDINWVYTMARYTF